MGQRFWVYAAVSALAVCSIAIGVWQWKRPPAPREPIITRQSAAPSATEAKTAVYLYFASRSADHLTAEPHAIRSLPDPGTLGARIVKTLIQGPRGPLTRTLPPETRLRAFFITPDGTAYLDFSGEIASRHPGGIDSEMLTVYSVVNSLVLNVPQVEAVKFLVEGREAASLSGHLDISSPFTANMLLIR